jgi:hypothetical protein
VTRDYTNLATWEGDTDVDIATAEVSPVLECYNDAEYTSGNVVTLSGATTSSSYFRIIRAANRADKPIFKFTGSWSSATKIAIQSEPYSSIQDLIAYSTSDANTTFSYRWFEILESNGADIVGCVAYDMANSGTGVVNAFFLYFSSAVAGEAKFINCVAYSCETGFLVNAGKSDALTDLFNCTAHDCTIGFNSTSSTGTTAAYGCGAADCTTAFNGTWDVQANCSTTHPTFADSYHLASNDATWKDQDGNTGSWHASCGYDDDIDGETRTGTWDIGCDEYVAGEPSGEPAEGSGYQTSYSIGAAAQKQPASGQGYAQSYQVGTASQKQPVAGAGYTQSYAIGAAAQKQPVVGNGHGESYAIGQAAALQMVPVTGDGYAFSYGTGALAQIQPAAGSGHTVSYPSGGASELQMIPVTGEGFTRSYSSGSIAQLQLISGQGHQTSYGRGWTVYGYLPRPLGKTSIGIRQDRYSVGIRKETHSVRIREEDFSVVIN